MPYPRSLLNDDESIAVDLHPHWWYFAEPVALLAASIVVGILSLTTDISWLGPVVLIALAVSIVWIVVRYLKWITTNFVVTSDRVIYRSGFFMKSGIHIPLERVNTVFFRQGPIERVLGTGDLVIESAGEEGQQRFTDIHDPDRVQNVIHHQMDLNEERIYRGGPAPESDVASQLVKLEGMLQRGTLTQEEFDAQKRRLLGSP